MIVKICEIVQFTRATVKFKCCGATLTFPSGLRSKHCSYIFVIAKLWGGPSPPVDPHEPEYNGEFRRVCAGEYNESCFEGIAISFFYILLTAILLDSYTYTYVHLF